MNMLAAADETMEVARKVLPFPYDTRLPEEFGFKHLSGMHTRMSVDTMSKSKLGRWLGWMQAAVVAGAFLNGHPEIDLEYMKALNQRHKKDGL